MTNTSRKKSSETTLTVRTYDFIESEEFNNIFMAAANPPKGENKKKKKKITVDLRTAKFEH